MIDPLLGSLDLAKLIDDLQSPQPKYVALDYECGPFDILIEGTEAEVEQSLIQIGAMIRTGNIVNADMSNVRIKLKK